MKTESHLLLRCHAVLLRLYPAAFRISFGEEIHLVFKQIVEEAAAEGSAALVKVFLQELRDLPQAAIAAHWHERTHEEDQWSSRRRRTNKWEVLLALATFLIPSGYLLINTVPGTWISRIILPILLVFLATSTMTGLIKRLPRWSLSYMGLLISAVVFLYLFHWEAQRIGTFLAARFVVQPDNGYGRLLLNIFWEGVVWLSLLLFAAGVILLMTRLKHFQSLKQHLHQDWTLLSYLVYNGSMLALFLVFEDYRNAEPYLLTAQFCLAAGAWGYLRSRRPLNGLWSMILGGSLAMGVAALGMWILVPLQDWTSWFRWHSPEQERWFEVQRALIGWFWMVVVLVLPALTRLLHRARPQQPRLPAEDDLISA
jgi:hypothetical protein